jgi:predicted O-methyltransferase YrrM
MKRLGRHDTGFQLIDVWGSKREVEFRVAGATHAWWHRHRFLTGLAWDNLAAAALLRPAGPPRSVLMLGLAGGTAVRVLRHLVPDARVVAVEIDPGIVDLARRFMRLDDLGIDVHLDDAYAWVRRFDGGSFDVVIDDVYQALPDDVARPAAYSRETGDALRRLVARDGLLVANLVTGPGHRRVQSCFRRFFREMFPVVRSVTTPAGANEALVGAGEVASGRVLAGWRESFPDPADRAFWDLLRVRRLPAAAPRRGARDRLVSGWRGREGHGK